jgi:hypothetical protein
MKNDRVIMNGTFRRMWEEEIVYPGPWMEGLKTIMETINHNSQYPETQTQYLQNMMQEYLPL